MSELRSDRIVEFVAKRCKQLRENKKLSQLTVLNDTGINISRIENGANEITIVSVQTLADYFGLNMSDFFKMDFFPAD